MKLPSSLRNPICTALLFGASLSASSGCVGLNIPSTRYYDQQPPAGHGRTLDEALLFSRDHVTHDPFAGDGEVCRGGDCGPPMSEGEAPTSELHSSKPKLPSVPWPRFHPVPTSPVFGG